MQNLFFLSFPVNDMLSGLLSTLPTGMKNVCTLSLLLLLQKMCALNRRFRIQSVGDVTDRVDPAS